MVMGAHLPDGVARSAANVCYSAGALAEVMIVWVEQPYRAWVTRELSVASGLGPGTIRMVVRDLVAAGHAVRVPGVVVPGGSRRAHQYQLTRVGMAAWRDFRPEARVRHRPVKATPLTPRL
jgi:DNA-binding MarR family transcriptional regulator